VVHDRARGFCITNSGEKFPFRWFPPGEIFGGAAFLSKPVDYLVSTEAVRDTTALGWDRPTIRSFSAQFPQLLENGLLIAYDYFVLDRSLHISATCHSARQRLAQVLGNLASGLGAGRGRNWTWYKKWGVGKRGQHHDIHYQPRFEWMATQGHSDERPRKDPASVTPEALIWARKDFVFAVSTRLIALEQRFDGVLDVILNKNQFSDAKHGRRWTSA
jgi:hypothetical protein